MISRRSKIREIEEYHGDRDLLFLRYDIKGPNDQQFVTWTRAPKSKRDLAKLRNQARKVLESVMRKQGWKYADLKPLSIPRGMEPPNFKSLPP